MTAPVFYNEWDAFAAAWLRNLIAAGELPHGSVDERSICDIDPAELRSFRQCHFFAGIGGWPYALDLAGWPEDREIWTGSCPCQPLSSAGQHKGHVDERHLWPAFYRLIAECRPATIVGEQVASRDGREWLAGVRADLEELGYAVGAADLPAAGVAAPQRRQRLFWVADAGRLGAEYRGELRPGETSSPHPADERQGLQRQRRGPDPRSGGAATAERLADTAQLRCTVGSGAAHSVARPETHQREPQRPGERGTAGGLGDAAVARRSQQPRRDDRANGWQKVESRRSGDASGLGDAETTRRPLGAGLAEMDGASARQGSLQAGVVLDRSRAGRVGVAGGDRRKQRRQPEHGDEQGALGLQPDRPGARGFGNGAADALADAKRDGGRADLEERQAKGRAVDFWSDAEWLFCRDGKARRVKPGIQPLAYGLPNRVGILRGAGNAIVPQLAVIFIRAAMECLAE